jgi:hypothetical protein
VKRPTSDAEFGTKVAEALYFVSSSIMAGRSGFSSQQKQEFFSLAPCQDKFWVPLILYPFGPGDCFLGQHEADHSLSYTDEVENACSCIITYLYAFMARDLLKHGENFTFL